MTPSDPTTWITITLIALIFSAFFSGVEMAYISSDRVRVELDVSRGGLLARLLHRFYSHSEILISTLLVGNNVVLVIYGMGAAALMEPWLATFINQEWLILIVQTLVSTCVIMITGEFLPKTLFGINPNSSFKIVAVPLFLIYIVLYPISVFASWLSKGFMRVAGFNGEKRNMHIISIGELNDYIEESIDDLQEQKQTIEHEVKIFHNALDFSSTHVRDCMIPRNEIVAVNIDTGTREQLVDLFVSTGRSKVIVYKGDIDTILGYIHVSELFDPSADWKEHIKPVLYTPENLLANVMMRRLLQQKRSIAIVVDEFGGTSGMLTLEDLMEEICGNIEDEHDKSGLIMRETTPGVYELSGRCEIAEINERFSLDLPEDDSYQTIAGYILNITGTIPQQGAVVEAEPYTFDILKKAANRLELIRLTVIASADGE